jgi:hypothetical protein
MVAVAGDLTRHARAYPIRAATRRHIVETVEQNCLRMT